MTHFETVLVESIRDLAKQVEGNNVLCARLDERSQSTERRLQALEACARAAVAGPGSAPRSSRRRAYAKAGISATAIIGLATAILHAISGPAPAAPRPPAPAVASGAP